MIGLSGHDGRCICEELAENMCVIFVEFREYIIEEEEWFFSGILFYIFAQESDKGEQENLIFPTREDVLSSIPCSVYLD